MKCAKCGWEIENGDLFCGNCGAKAEPPAPRCPSCGRELKTTARFCPYCGSGVEAGAQPRPAAPRSPQAWAPAPPPAPPEPPRERKPVNKKKLIAIIVSSVAALALIVAGVLVARYFIQRQRMAEEFQAQMDLGVRMLEDGNYREAVLAFRAAIDIDPKQAAPHLGLGDAYTGLEDFSRAESSYLSALELDDSLADAYLGLANAYIEQDMLDEGVAALHSGAATTEDPRISEWLDALQGASGTGSIQGTVSGYLPGGGSEFLPGAQVKLYLPMSGALRLVRSQLTDYEGAFSLDGLAAGEYSLHVNAVDHIALDTAETLTEGEISYTELFLLIPETEETMDSTLRGALSGVVTNAIDGYGVPGATVIIREGWNNTTDPLNAGEYYADSYGMIYVPELKFGYYTAEVRADGFTPACHNFAVLPDDFYSEWNFAVSPILDDGETRVVLTWNDYPYDLDSHLCSRSFHVYFESKNYYDGSRVHRVNLDLDDTSSYGPETVTVYRGLEETATYFVHDYTNRNNQNSTALSLSGATVRVYQRYGLAATFHVPANRAGDTWTVFTISPSGEITPVNSFGMVSAAISAARGN